MVVGFLPVALMASATALPSDSVKPPSISTASLGPDTRTGARKKPFCPAGKCFQASPPAAWPRPAGAKTAAAPAARVVFMMVLLVGMLVSWCWSAIGKLKVDGPVSVDRRAQAA